MPYTHNKELTPNSKKLRKTMTPRERKLWYCFLKDYPLKFYRQRVIENYIVDFYCSQAKLIIEVDGYFHYDERRIYYERERTEFLEKSGYKVIRFTNGKIDEDFEDVCRMIDYEVKSRMELL